MALTAMSIQEALVDALSKSSAIAAACVSYFGVPHEVVSGGTGRHGGSSPTFAVVAWSRTAGEDDIDRAFDFSVLLSISDDTITTTVEDVVIAEGEGEDPDTEVEVSIETYGGPAKLEALLELAASEVLEISSEITIRDLTYTFESLEYFPLFIGGLDFTVTYPVLIGGFEPTIT